MASPFKYLPYKMASVRGGVCVRACAVEIKPRMLRAACFVDVRVWTHIRFALQDGDFHSKKEVIINGLLAGNLLSALQAFMQLAPMHSCRGFV